MTESVQQERPKRSLRVLGWMLVPLILLAALGAWFALDPGFRWGHGGTRVAADMPKDQFERRVRAFLLEHPEVIAEAISRLESRRGEEEATEAQAALKSRADEVFRDPDSPVGGNPHGDVTLVEFFDYNCPYCRQVAPLMLQAEAADPKLRLVFKEFPILGPGSTFAAKAALAAHKQGKYLAFHHALMKVRGKVEAKTGTLTWDNLLFGRGLCTSKALAGYLTTMQGRRLAFAAFVNGVHLKDGIDTKRLGSDLGKLCEIVYAER